MPKLADPSVRESEQSVGTSVRQTRERRSRGDRRMMTMSAGRRGHQRTSQQRDMAAAVKKRKVRLNTDVEQFEAQSIWGGAQRDMAVVRRKIRCDHEVSEFYSPPRVVTMAREPWMKLSLDLTVPANDGYVWDCNRKHFRDRALQTVNEKRLLFLMVSPECTPYSNIQNLNMRTPAGKAKVELAIPRGHVHLKFCMTLARRQMDGGRYFIYEHPKSAASWNNPDVDRLASTEGVMWGQLDQ